MLNNLETEGVDDGDAGSLHAALPAVHKACAPIVGTLCPFLRTHLTKEINCR